MFSLLYIDKTTTVAARQPRTIHPSVQGSNPAALLSSDELDAISRDPCRQQNLYANISYNIPDSLQY